MDCCPVNLVCLQRVTLCALGYNSFVQLHSMQRQRFVLFHQAGIYRPSRPVAEERPFLAFIVVRAWVKLPRPLRFCLCRNAEPGRLQDFADISEHAVSRGMVYM